MNNYGNYQGSYVELKPVDAAAKHTNSQPAVFQPFTINSTDFVDEADAREAVFQPLIGEANPDGFRRPANANRGIGYITVAVGVLILVYIGVIVFSCLIENSERPFFLLLPLIPGVIMAFVPYRKSDATFDGMSISLLMGVLSSLIAMFVQGVLVLFVVMIASLISSGHSQHHGSFFMFIFTVFNIIIGSILFALIEAGSMVFLLQPLAGLQDIVNVNSIVVYSVSYATGFVGLINCLLMLAAVEIDSIDATEILWSICLSISAFFVQISFRSAVSLYGLSSLSVYRFPLLRGHFHLRGPSSSEQKQKYVAGRVIFELTVIIAIIFMFLAVPVVFITFWNGAVYWFVPSFITLNSIIIGCICLVYVIWNGCVARFVANECPVINESD